MFLWGFLLVQSWIMIDAPVHSSTVKSFEPLAQNTPHYIGVFHDRHSRQFFPKLSQTKSNLDCTSGDLCPVDWKKCSWTMGSILVCSNGHSTVCIEAFNLSLHRLQSESVGICSMSMFWYVPGLFVASCLLGFDQMVHSYNSISQSSHCAPGWSHSIDWREGWWGGGFKNNEMGNIHYPN